MESLKLQINRHWREHRPKMYAQLKQSGRLEQSIHLAAERTMDALTDLLQDKVPYNQAWEAVREEWAFLPDEEDVPVLGENADPEKAPITT